MGFGVCPWVLTVVSLGASAVALMGEFLTSKATFKNNS